MVTGNRDRMPQGATDFCLRKRLLRRTAAAAESFRTYLPDGSVARGAGGTRTRDWQIMSLLL